MGGAAVRVDTASPVPPYERIRAQLASLILTRRGAGTRVAPLPPGARRRETAELAEVTKDFVARTRALGFGEEEVLEAVRRALRT
ncbi:hypothetical protein ACFWIO_06375 [Streptomyces diastatochromogenes]|uniref:hypothetical protein n=1 Tax=Streptomyces diastatochromogenes TaxID=42236 RepID=UPI00364C5C0E